MDPQREAEKDARDFEEAWHKQREALMDDIHGQLDRISTDASLSLDDVKKIKDDPTANKTELCDRLINRLQSIERQVSSIYEVIGVDENDGEDDADEE